MSVITAMKPNSRNTARQEREPSEYDGRWINIGVSMGDNEEESTFVRLPRGVAISDLKQKKVYDNMDPEYAAQVNLMNQLIALIQKKCLLLGEGESCAIQLEAQLYCRQEEADVAPTPEANNNLELALFG